MATIKKGQNQFYIEDESDRVVAQISFLPKGKDRLVIQHTYVPRSLAGQGLGLQLVNSVCDYARQENRKIIPICWFAKKVMTESDEYKDVLESGD